MKKPGILPPAQLQERSEVAAARWGRSGRVHGLEFTKNRWGLSALTPRDTKASEKLWRYICCCFSVNGSSTQVRLYGLYLWVIVLYLPAVWFGCSRQVAAGICCVSPRLDASVAVCRRTLSFALRCQQALVQWRAFAEEEQAAGTDCNTMKRAEVDSKQAISLVVRSFNNSVSLSNGTWSRRIFHLLRSNVSFYSRTINTAKLFVNVSDNLYKHTGKRKCTDWKYVKQSMALGKS